MKATIGRRPRGRPCRLMLPGVAPRSRARMVEDRIDMLALAMEQMEAQIMELTRDLSPKKQ